MRARGNRKTQRDEMQQSWNVYDALRPIRKEDFDEPVEETQELRTHAPVPTGVALPDPDKVTEMTDAEIAALMGITEMDVREARKWAREQSERLGAVTVVESSDAPPMAITGIDTAACTIEIESYPDPFPSGHPYRGRH